MLFIATHAPRRTLPKVQVNDKVVHFLAYALLGGLLFASLKLSARRWRLDVAVLVLLVGMAYGAADEWLQNIPALGRSGDLADWFADVAGVASAVVTMSLLWSLRGRGGGVGGSPG